MNDCLFCKIVKGEIPATKVYEDEKVIGFKDLRPQAKIHHLFIHKNHSKNLNDLISQEPTQASEILGAITYYASQEKLVEPGYRVVTNIGPNAGQTVFHTHFHLLGGEGLGHFGS
jgi:histidine triad (HIT) family protein